MYQVFEKKVFNQALPKVVKTPRKIPSSRIQNKTSLQILDERSAEKKLQKYPSSYKLLDSHTNDQGEGNRRAQERYMNQLSE